MRNVGQIVICVALFGVIAGCSNPNAAALSKPSKTVAWPELTALRDPAIGREIVLNAQRGDIAALKKAATAPKVSEAVEAFAASKIPSQFASPAREKAKDKVVKDYKSLISMCSGMGSDKDIKAQALSLPTAFDELTNPDLK